MGGRIAEPDLQDRGPLILFFRVGWVWTSYGPSLVRNTQWLHDYRNPVFGNVD